MVKILVVSDTEMPQLRNAENLRRRYSDIDLVLSCGDMSPSYLDFICTVLSRPLLYVRGNHDEMYNQMCPGGVNLHGKIFQFKGLTFAGLEGCLRYNKGTVQYTQFEMLTKVIKLAHQMPFRKWRKGHAVDVFVTHSPPRGIHDIEDDYPHRGFDAFINFMDWYRPRYMLHGHVHIWDQRTQIETIYKDTTVLNINPYMVLEIDPVETE